MCSILYAWQAFLHYALKASKGQFLICNIQGVGQSFAAPRIHTLDGKGFGQGNDGEEGVKKFSHLHVCNHVCRRLALDQDAASVSGSTSASSTSVNSPIATPGTVSPESGSRATSPASRDSRAYGPRPASSSHSRHQDSRLQPGKYEGPEKIEARHRSKSGDCDTLVERACGILQDASALSTSQRALNADPDRDPGVVESGQAAEHSAARASSLWKAGAANALEQKSKGVRQHGGSNFLEGQDGDLIPKRIPSVLSLASYSSGSSREREVASPPTHLQAASPSRASSLWKVGITGAMSSLYNTLKGENRSIRERVAHAQMLSSMHDPTGQSSNAAQEYPGLSQQGLSDNKTVIVNGFVRRGPSREARISANLVKVICYFMILLP